MNKQDIIVCGYGGQGVLTLAEIIARSGVKAGFQVSQAELHGLAQRGGALQVQVRLRKEISPPLIKRGGADLIVSLDLLEALRACSWANPEKTMVLSNSAIFWPYQSQISVQDTEQEIRELVKELKIVEADRIVEEMTGQKMAVNIFILASVLKEKLLPFDRQLAWQVVAEKLKGKSLEENKRVFDKAFKTR